MDGVARSTARRGRIRWPGPSGGSLARSQPAVHQQRAVDAALLERIGAGDYAALAQLYERLGGAIYSLAYRIVGDGPSAEDVVQEVFLATWR